MTTVIITNEELNDMMKVIKGLEDSDVLLKGATKITKNETKEQKGEVFGMLLGTLGASLLGNMLARRDNVRALYGNKKAKQGKGDDSKREVLKWIFNISYIHVIICLKK